MVTKSEILKVRSLHDRESRSQLGLFIAEGMKIVEEIINSDFEVECVYITEKGLQNLDKKIKFNALEQVSQKEMERMSTLKSATPILAVVKIPKYSSYNTSKSELSIALDTVQDPGNLGTIIRLADWFGIGQVICSIDCVDCFSPKVIQATMGAILRVKVYYTDLVKYLSKAKSEGISIYGTFLEGDNIYKKSLSQGGIIIMGNEGRGISKEVSTLIDNKLYIPPYPIDKGSNSESLNVAVATAVICSEFRRRV